MKKEVGQLIKHSGIYGVGSLLSKSVGFLMIPVYTRYLAPVDYGVLELLDLVMFFAGIFSMMGIQSAFFRFYSAYDSEEERQGVVSTALLCVAGVSVLVALVMVALARPLSILTFGSVGFVRYVRIVALTLLFSNLTEVPLAYLRARQKTVVFVVVNLCRTILNAGVLIIAVAGLHMGVEGVVYGNLLASVLVGVILFSALLARVGVKVSKQNFEELSRFGIPLIVPSLASFVLVFSDRLFLRQFSTLGEVGIYGLAYKLAGAVPLLATGPFGMTWAWQQFEFAKQQKTEIFARVQTYQIIVSVFVALAVSVFAKDALRILTPSSYWGAARVVPLISCCYVVEGIRAVVNSGILIRKVTHHLAMIGIVVAGVDLLLNYMLIPRYHAMGAAVATLLAYSVSLTMSYLAAQRVFHIRFEYARSSIVLGSATIIYLSSQLVELPLAASAARGLFLLLVFCAVCYSILDGRERNALLLQVAGTWRQVAASLDRYIKSARA